MDAGRFHLVVSIFKDACQLPVEARGQFLLARCGDDVALRQEVEALLREDENSLGPIAEAGGGQQVLAAGMARAAGVSALESQLRPHVPVLAGQYQIIRTIGEGGMGTVYEAQQAIPRRTVALKAIRRGLASREMLRRFEHEAHILGRLHHPGIAQVYEAGVSDETQPDQAFIAMELVRGRPLTEFADAERYDVRNRLELMIKVCDAVQHAHQRGVIHRDLKPANILVEQNGQPKILDFGVARAIGGEHPLTTMHTHSGQVLGTIPYMSPEQVAGDPEEVDTRTDVYALGVLLYQLLAGRLPHDFRNKSLPEAARIIRDDAPLALGAIKPHYRGELETIVARAIDKERERRYRSAADLGSDLQRYLNGEPVDAKRDSALYVLRKSLKRYRGVVAVALIMVATLAAFGIVSYRQARENEWLATERAQQRDRADAEAAKLRRTLYLSRIGFAHAAMLAQNEARFRRLLSECPVELRGWEWNYLNRLADRSFATLSCGSPAVADAALSRDGRSLAIGRVDGELMLFDAAARTTRSAQRMPGPIAALALNADGTRLFCALDSGGVGFWSRDPDREAPFLHVREGADGHRIRELALSRDEAVLFAGGNDGWLRVYDTAALNLLWEAHAHELAISRILLHDDGRLVTVGRDHALKLWDLNRRETVHTFVGHRLPLHAAAISRDGRILASAGLDAEIILWDLDTGAEIRRLTAHMGNIWTVEFSPDGRHLISAGDDRHLRVWNVGTWDLAHTMRGHADPIMFAGNPVRGDELITCDFAGKLKWWPWPPADETPLIVTGAENAMAMALSADGSFLLSGGTGQVLRRWDGQTREQLAEMHGHTGAIYSVDISPSGQWLVSAGLDRRVILWSTLTGEAVAEAALGERAAYIVRFSPDERTIALGLSDGRVSLVNIEGLSEQFTVHPHLRAARALAFRRDGRQIVTGGMDGRVKFISAADGTELRAFQAHRELIMSLALSADESLMVTTGSEGSVNIWQTDTGRRLAECVGHLGPVRCAAFSPDGLRLATCGADESVRLWEVATGEEFFALTGHGRPVSVVRFSPDGRRLYSCGDDGAIRYWQSQPDR